MHTERGLALGCPIISKHWRGSCRSSSKYSHKEKKKRSSSNCDSEREHANCRACQITMKNHSYLTCSIGF